MYCCWSIVLHVDCDCGIDCDVDCGCGVDIFLVVVIMGVPGFIIASGMFGDVI